MDENSIILDETVFTMEVEGFLIPENEKEIIQRVLAGELSFQKVLQEYIANAKLCGGAVNAAL